LGGHCSRIGAVGQRPAGQCAVGRCGLARKIGHAQPEHQRSQHLGPSPASPNYGYERWVTVGPNARPSQGIEIKAFDGGLYAVTRCTLDVISETWRCLLNWCQAAGHPIGSHQWIEEGLTPPRLEGPARPLDEIVMAPYLPIAG
jgi:hypothetical protein